MKRFKLRASIPWVVAELVVVALSLAAWECFDASTPVGTETRWRCIRRQAPIPPRARTHESRIDCADKRLRAWFFAIVMNPRQTNASRVWALNHLMGRESAASAVIETSRHVLAYFKRYSAEDVAATFPAKGLVHFRQQAVGIIQGQMIARADIELEDALGILRMACDVNGEDLETFLRVMLPKDVKGAPLEMDAVSPGLRTRAKRLRTFLSLLETGG